MCFPVDEVKQAIKDKQHKKVLEDVVSILNDEVSNLSSQIESHKITIKTMQGTAKEQKEIIRLYETKIGLMANQEQVLLKDIAALQKHIKRQKTKNTVINILTIAGGVAGTFLILK